ncbi:MAG: hypothetical protein ACRDJE_17430, partial [Dehalococcoidia bacterium]
MAYRRAARIHRRRLLTLAAGTGGAALAGIALAGCGDSDPPAQAPSSGASSQRGGTLKSLLDEEPATLDPITPTGGVGNQLAAFAYSRLVRFKPGRGAFADGSVEPDLVTRWEQPDESTFILQLREGVVFDRRPPTNGRAFT